MSKKYDLSIVIATLGFESIYRTLDTLIGHKEGYDIEVLVIGNLNGNKIKDYPEFVRYFPMNFKKGDLSEKRNFGFKHAKSDIVAFIDDDVEIPAGWIEKGITHFAKDKYLGILSGPGIVPQQNVSFFSRLFGNTLASLGAWPIRGRYRRSGQEEYDSAGDKIIGCNMMIRKSVFKDIGGFDINIIPAEELDFAYRAIKKGYRVLRDSNFFLVHFARASPKKFFKQIFRFGRSKINSIQKGAQPFKIVYLSPVLALFLYCFIFVNLSLFPEILFPAFILSTSVYFLFVIICTINSILKDKYIWNTFLLLTIPFMHLAYAVGELYGLIKSE